MLRLLHVFAASAIFLWENVQSTTTSDNHSNSSALNLRTLPPRLDINASVAPSPLGPQVFTSNETKLEDQDSEERVRPSLHSLPLLTDGAETLITAGQHQGPEGYFHSLNLRQGLQDPSDLNSLEVWFKHIDDFRRMGHDFSNEKMLELLQTKASEVELMQLMKHPSMGDSFKQLLGPPEMIKRGWVKADMSPAEMYYWLPISGTERLTTSDMEAWEDVFRKLYDWFVWVETSRASGNVVSNGAIVEALVQQRGEEEAVEFLLWLRCKPDMKDRLYSLLQLLVMKKPTMLKELLQSCLAAHISPEEVLRMLPVGMTHEDNNEVLTDVFVIKIWFAYVDFFRDSDRVFSDNAIVEALVQKSGQQAAIKFLLWLRREDDMKDRLYSLLQLLVMKHPTIVQELLQSCLAEHISPEEVFRVMPIAAMKTITHADNKDVWRDIIRKLKDWYDYVKLFQHVHKNVFNDNDVVKVLVDNRGVSEAMVFLTLLGRDPNLKNTSDRMRQLLMQTHPKEMFESCLMADISPDEFIWMIPISLKHDTWIKIDKKLRVWYAYFFHFRRKAGNEYTDDSFMGALVQRFGAKWVEQYISELGNNLNMKASADTLRRHPSKPH